ncbi:hypothetical protein CSB45_00690 [candidate division KSB3 bacterium]|uniref:Peptidase S54 rhomboid domain-containing protein n=1 Tax=candidate division KSB3 bacterium TaxID=2044937 RepID=A0A2G6ED82_9BACT|nr:MAG: hypothetical protein CSB45_00690 [candidate division KSB3 bacterium]PIE31025.1 MAG: hypothetical protein CSA57_01530 [candidate division KSB3 bacterium]
MNTRHKFDVNCLQILIGLNVLIFFLLPKSGFWWQVALSSYGIKSLKLWQLVSYQFLHGSLTHLCFNMWGLYLFGRYVLKQMGTQRFLTLYFLSGISGALLWLLFNWNSRVPVIGASGAVFGVMMAAALYFPEMRIMLLIPPIPLKLRTFVLIYAAIEIFSEFSAMQSGIAHLAHLGGFLAAYLYIRLSSGESLGAVLKHPLAAFNRPTHQSLSYRPTTGTPSEINRKTFEIIMSEIEKLEHENSQATDVMDQEDKQA